MPAGSGYDTPESGFLWKPEADNGGLVILLPSKYRNSSVRLLGPDGSVIEQGRSTGYANGNREHFRFGQGGGAYPNGTVVEVTTSDGNVMRYQVQNTSSRWDFGGGSGGGGEGMSAEGMSALMGPTNLNIQKPNVSSRLGNIKQPNFEAPLSTLETIRNVSNIIVGATKSHDSIKDVETSEEVSGGEADLVPPDFKPELSGHMAPGQWWPSLELKWPEGATDEQIAAWKEENDWPASGADWGRAKREQRLNTMSPARIDEEEEEED